MTRAPRVLVSGVVLGQPPGGVRRHNQELLPRLARRLAARGGALAVLEGRERVAFDLPEEIERIPSDVPARPLILRRRRETSALRRALAAALAAGRPFDVVHTAHFPAPMALDTPLTLTIHDLRGLEERLATAPRRALTRAVIRGALAAVERVFTVSATVADEVRSRFSLARERVVVVGNGVDHFTPAARRADARAPIVCLGHLEPRKNLELVLRALATDPALPRVEFHGAAKDGADVRLARLARELHVESRVTIAGPFADEALPAIYARAACVCVPSLLEGFGIVALEAQRARVPTCVAAAGALPEVAGPDAPRFAPDDPAACAAAIRRALALEPAVIARAAERAEGFTWDRAADRWLAGLDFIG